MVGRTVGSTVGSKVGKTERFFRKKYLCPMA
jgi:hypothetical protein